MNFKDRFKVGDIVKYGASLYSIEDFLSAIEKPSRFERFSGQDKDRFEVKKLLGREIVTTFNNEDFIDGFIKIATDEDIIESLGFYLDNDEQIGEEITATFSDTNLILMGIYLEPKEAIELRNLINKYVGEL